MLQKVNSMNFGPEVLNEAGTVVVEVGAEWCPGCRYLKPVVEKLAQEGANGAKFVEVDADDADARDILVQYGISSLPTLLVIRNGQLVKKSVGFTGEKAVREMIAA
jgi:thioredoxin 1